MRRQLFICLLLAGITLAIYWPVRHYGIVYFDDPLFVTENAEIQSGLNWHSVWWALSSVLVANWHPVTSLSFVLDHQFFGTNPGAEHLVNVAFHVANAVLLFLVLNKMSGATWRSAVVAAIFAWHPLRVESVAWISERKDVLCGFFMMLTLWAWVQYVEKAEGQRPKAKVFYWLALIFFVLGLMSKPMLVTLPFALLLLDYWPLKRISDFGFRISDLKNVPQLLILRSLGEGGSTPWRGEAKRRRLNHLLFEKWPFFALAVFSSGLTFWIQKTHAAVMELSRLGMEARLGNAVTSYLQYLAKLFWPTKLAVIYPYPKSQDDAEIWLTALLLLAISILCVYQLSGRPYLAVGWFWFLGTAVPIIGLVQVGGQAMADRYTYIPLIGPVISLVWLVAEGCRSQKILSSAAATILLAACIGLTNRQLQFWRDTVALAERNISVTPENSPAYFNLGVGLEHAGETNQAMVSYRVATSIFPGNIEAHRNLAQLLRQQGRWTAAEEEYDTLLAINPDDSATHLSLARIVGQLGRSDEELFHLNESLRLNPDFAEAMNNLAWMLATSTNAAVRDGARAVQLAERAREITGGKKTIYLGTLAAAYAEAGQFDDAIATAQKACALASELGEQVLLKRNQELLALYLKHQPYHEGTSR